MTRYAMPRYFERRCVLDKWTDMSETSRQIGQVLEEQRTLSRHQGGRRTRWTRHPRADEFVAGQESGDDLPMYTTTPPD
ncbi:hypothetical protein C8039_20020 [Halogeometricum sp. wsp3]|nr:hypothetical protein C8039_20020 [Halogeometricum sp. wsp3]